MDVPIHLHGSAQLQAVFRGTGSEAPESRHEFHGPGLF